MFLVSPGPFEVKFLGKATPKAEMVRPVSPGPEVRGGRGVSSVTLTSGQHGVSQSQRPPSCPQLFSIVLAAAGDLCLTGWQTSEPHPAGRLFLQTDFY